MKEVVLLTKVLLKSSKSNTKKTNTTIASKIFTFLIFLFVYLYLAGIVGYITYQAVESLISFNRQEIFLNICFMGLLGFSLFQSIFASLNVLFFSKDLETLLPFPIKPYKIIMAKFNSLVFSQYLIYFVVAVPVLLVYGYLLKLGALYYVYSALILLIFPIIPVVIISLLLTIIMKFTNVIKNKETVQYITVFFSIIIICLAQFAMGSGKQEITNEEMAQTLIGVNEQIEENFSFLINVKFAVKTLINYQTFEGLKNFGMLLLSSLVIYTIISLFTSKFYIKTITSMMNKGSKTKKRSLQEKYYKKRIALKSYLSKEIKNLVRNPIFLMQCVVPPFLFPLIFLVPSVMALSEQGENSVVLVEYLSSYINTPFGLVTSLEVLELLYIFNFATITSISRDGADAKVMKYLPVDLNKQLTYKSILGILFNIAPLVYVIAIIKITLSVNTLTLVYITILAILINIFNNFLVIIVDLKNPKTEWITEYAVVKQNLNMFFQMIIIVTQMGLLFLATRLENLNKCFIILSIILIVLIILIKKYTAKYKQKLFEKIY